MPLSAKVEDTVQQFNRRQLPNSRNWPPADIEVLTDLTSDAELQAGSGLTSWLGLPSDTVTCWATHETDLGLSSTPSWRG